MECEVEVTILLHVFSDKIFSYRFQFKIFLLKHMHHGTILGQVEISNDKQILNLIFVLGHFGFGLLSDQFEPFFLRLRRMIV